MNIIENRAIELRATFIDNALEFGLTQDEIDAALSDDDGCDSFLLEAEAEARRALAASRQKHRRTIRAVTSRKPETRRAPRRAARKACASADDDGVGDGSGPWSLQAIETFYAFKALCLLSPSLRTSSGIFCKYQGPTILNRIPRVAVSVNCFGEYPNRTFQISWTDAATGRHGFSVISLVSHILKITEPAAADRLARFASNVLATRDARVNVETALEQFKIGYVFPFGRRAV